ncbi:MAG: homoserine kinase [Actinomycetota bacterium]|nr:homoserine kinase [Actinomycetota bacterium]
MTASSAVAAVSVPATSANLGPGYDCLGLALEIRDHYRAEVDFGGSVGAEPDVVVEVVGQGSDGSVGVRGDNLVARSLLRGLIEWGAPPVAAVRLHCNNAVPHGRGLGSSSAAIVGGLGLARELAPRELSSADVLALASAIEGHPDNVAPAVLGGFTVSWTEVGVGRALRLAPHPGVGAVIAVPPSSLSTAEARGLMPAQVPLVEAVHNLSRTALLTQALTSHPEFLLAGTEDLLHQPRRAGAYVASHALVSILRMDRHAAVISGAGPTVLVLTAGDVDQVATEVAEYTGAGWQVSVVPFAGEGARVEDAQRSPA